MGKVNLSAPVVDGQIYTGQTPDNTSKDTTGTGELGKDAFLQLLVTQMKYQDPLNPTSDTEYIAQLATFSTLEEMQNINSTISNMQGYNLVGEYVMLKTENSAGETVLTGGKVDYAFIEGGDMYLNVNGEDYSIEDLDTVVTEEYVQSQASMGNSTSNDLAQAAQLVGKNVTLSSDGKRYQGEVEQVYMDKGTVYLTVNSKAYTYDSLISVNKVEEISIEEKTEVDYLELLTKDVTELKELFQGMVTPDTEDKEESETGDVEADNVEANSPETDNVVGDDSEVQENPYENTPYEDTYANTPYAEGEE